MADPQDQQQQQQKPAPTVQVAQYKEQVPSGWEPHTPVQTAKPAHPAPTEWQAQPQPQTHMPQAQEPGEPPKNYGFTFGNMYANGIRGISELGTGLWNTGKEILNPELSPEQQKQGEVGKELSRWKNIGNNLVVQPAVSEEKKASAALNDPSRQWDSKQGIAHNLGNWASRQTESFGHGLAAVVPMVGPWAAGVGEQAGTGDVGGALTRGAVQYGVSEAAPRVPGLIKKGGESILRGVGKTMAEGAEAGKDAHISPLDAAEYQRLGMEPPKGTTITTGDGELISFDRWLKDQNVPAVKVVNPKEATPPTQAQVNTAATRAIRDHQIADYNEKYADAGNGTRIKAVRGNVEITPEGVRSNQPPPSTAEINDLANQEISKMQQKGNGNGSMIQRDTPKPPTPQAEVDRLATQEVEKAQPKDSPAQAEARRMMRHRVPEDLQDRLIRDNPDVGARLIKGTNQNYADVANQLNMPGAGEQGWTASDFSRAGSEMSAKKAMVMRHLMENYAPEEVLDMTKSWGGKQTPRGVSMGDASRRYKP
jgi:hypothetical protein